MITDAFLSILLKLDKFWQGQAMTIRESMDNYSKYYTCWIFCFLHLNAILSDIVFLFIILAKLCCQRLLLCNKMTIRCSVSVITLLLQGLAYFWMCWGSKHWTLQNKQDNLIVFANLVLSQEQNTMLWFYCIKETSDSTIWPK